MIEVNRRTFLGAAAATAVVATLPSMPGPTRAASARSGWLAVLTPRERQAVLLLAHGLTIREISRLLGVSRRTLEVRIFMIYKRLGLHARSELIEMTRRLGPQLGIDS